MKRIALWLAAFALAGTLALAVGIATASAPDAAARPADATGAPGPR